MIMPRNLAFLQGVILTYQMLALRTSIDVLFNISGGRRQLSDQLKSTKESIRYKAFPFCCCSCLPVVAPSVRNIRKLENVISQTCVVRVVLQVADICVMRETGETTNWWFVSSYVFSFITMTVSLYFSCVVANLNRDTGNRFRYNYLFYAVNISQILYTLQRTLFTGVKYLINVEKDSFSKSLIDYDYFEETYYLMFVFSVEVALMSIIISIIMRPGVTYIFDSYSCRSTSAKFLPLDPSGRGDFESKEEVKDGSKEVLAKKEQGKKEATIPMGPDTVMKTLGRDQTEEPKKLKSSTAVEDDGNYENLTAASDGDLKKVLKNMEKK